ncbi:hypothetical protein I4U23_016227 [Adineta vaga]|nr:hypothetical protein I4U23_016227 [Adineta vaga]
MEKNDEMSRILDAKFSIMVILLSISIPCSICIFIYFYQLRKKISIHQHLLTFILVLFCFLDMIINYLIALYQNRNQRVISETSSFCAWWNWWAYSLTIALVWVVACGSIERHLLIFHNTLIATRKRRFFLHILPMLTAITYSYTFYFIVITFHSCEDYWDYKSLLCLLPCFIYSEPTVALYDFVMHTIMPLSIITVANVALIVRVLMQKKNQQRDWQRKWKLAIYLILIAIFFMITWYPLAINSIIYMYTSSSVSTNLQMKYFFSLPSLLEMILPIVSLFFLPNFKKTVFRFRQITIIPQAFNR